jgi:stearoyl-CoA desaturase (delta-9 desaturase)
MNTARRRRWNLVQSIPFFAIHAVALGVLFTPFSWGLVALCLGLYAVRMFAVTAGYHRYFSHRSYKMGRVPQFLLALLGTTATQKGVLWWAAHHRHHHRFSDQPADLHSPVQDGFWHSHLGWILASEHDETRWDQIADLAKYPELVWLNRWHLVPPVALGVGLWLAGGVPAFLWGFALSTVLLWHGTFSINSLAHVWGGRRYRTTDDSRNNFWLALITLGEGWHNNHHTYQSAARQGFYWWEIDLSYYALKMLSFLGVTRDLRQPPLTLLDAKRVDRAAPAATAIVAPAVVVTDPRALAAVDA